MAPTFLGSRNIQTNILDKILKNVFRWTFLDELLSYTDAKGNPQIANVSYVFKKCAKDRHVWCDICQCEFSQTRDSSNFSMNGMNRSLRLLVFEP